MTAAHSRRPNQVLRFSCLALTGLLLASGCRQQSQDLSQIPHTPVPKTDARLQLASAVGDLRYEGVVVDEAARADLLRTLRTVYGGDAAGAITVDPNTLPAAWARSLGPLCVAFKAPGGTLAFQGRQIELGGTVSDEARARLLRKAQQLYPGYTLTGLFQGVDMRNALPEEGDIAGLLAYLNAIPIAFQADSGMIVPASLDGLGRGARAIKGADDATRLRIGVYAEAGDSADYARQIASQRAEAVRLQLVIRGVPPPLLAFTALPNADGKGGTVEFTLAAEDTPAGGEEDAAPRPVPDPAGRDTLPSAGDGESATDTPAPIG